MDQETKSKSLRQHAEPIAIQNLQEQNLSEFDTTPSPDESIIIKDDTLKSMQLDLEDAANSYTALYDFSPIGYFTLDSNGLIIRVNPIGENMLGVKNGALLNHNFARYIAPDYQYIFSEFLSRINQDLVIAPCELKLLKRYGPLYYARLEAKRIFNPKTNSSQILLIIIDINLRKRVEENVHQYQHQMENVDPINYIGELAAIIAHELNHPHAVISNYIQGTIGLLESGKYKIPDLLQAMKKASQQLDRAGEIILRMKNFTSKGTLNYENICIHTIIKETLALIDHEIEGFPLTVRYMPIGHAFDISADRIHIQQVILNLARNAIEAMKDGHTIEPKLTIEANHISKDYIEISIHDNGPGLSTSAINRLFDPHFTTKPYGIGLGLAVSRAVIQSHGGELFIESSLNKGSCFKFTLPIAKLKTKPGAYFQ